MKTMISDFKLVISQLHQLDFHLQQFSPRTNGFEREYTRLLYWNLLCFWEEEEDEAAHDQNQSGKQQENPISKMAERYKKAFIVLSNSASLFLVP